MQFTIANNFISSIDNDKEYVMCSKSDKIEIMINDETDEVMKQLFLLYYKFHKIIPNRVGSYIDSPDWIKHLKGYKNDYALTVALHFEEMKKDPQRITKIKYFINKCNRKVINFLSDKDDWNNIDKNIVTITLNVLYAKKEKCMSCLCFKT